MLTWFPVIIVAFGSLSFAACNLFYFPMSLPQFLMICASLYISLLLADIAVLSKKLKQVERELDREHTILAASRY